MGSYPRTSISTNEHQRDGCILTVRSERTRSIGMGDGRAVNIDSCVHGEKCDSDSETEASDDSLFRGGPVPASASKKACSHHVRRSLDISGHGSHRINHSIKKGLDSSEHRQKATKRSSLSSSNHDTSPRYGTSPTRKIKKNVPGRKITPASGMPDAKPSSPRQESNKTYDGRPSTGKSTRRRSISTESNTPTTSPSSSMNSKEDCSKVVVPSRNRRVSIGCMPTVEASSSGKETSETKPVHSSVRGRRASIGNISSENIPVPPDSPPGPRGSPLKRRKSFGSRQQVELASSETKDSTPSPSRKSLGSRQQVDPANNEVKSPLKRRKSLGSRQQVESASNEIKNSSNENKDSTTCSTAKNPSTSKQGRRGSNGGSPSSPGNSQAQTKNLESESPKTTRVSVKGRRASMGCDPSGGKMLLSGSSHGGNVVRSPVKRRASVGYVPGESNEPAAVSSTSNDRGQGKSGQKLKESSKGMRRASISHTSSEHVANMVSIFNPTAGSQQEPRHVASTPLSEDKIVTSSNKAPASSAGTKSKRGRRASMGSFPTTSTSKNAHGQNSDVKLSHDGDENMTDNIMSSSTPVEEQKAPVEVNDSNEGDSQEPSQKKNDQQNPSNQGFGVLPMPIKRIARRSSIGPGFGSSLFKSSGKNENQSSNNEGSTRGKGVTRYKSDTSALKSVARRASISTVHGVDSEQFLQLNFAPPEADPVAG